MFLHLLKYNIKVLLRSKEVVFWIIAFPILLSTLFYIVLNGAFENQSFEKINIALVDSQNDETFVEMLKQTELVNAKETTKDKADELLSKGEIIGIIEVSKKPKLTVMKNGLYQSILKTICDSYIQANSTVSGVIQQNPDIIKTNFFNNIEFAKEYTIKKSINNSGNVMATMFYALLAMMAFTGATLSMNAIEMFQADQSAKAARINIAPISKIKGILAALLGTIGFQIINMLIVIAYIALVLKVDLGDKIGHIILLVFAGVFAGIMMGAMISSFIKKSGVKVGVIMTTTMVCSSVSGLQNPDIKYYIQENLPFLAAINPANRMVDGMFSLYYYGVGQRYYGNLIALFLFGIVFCAITYLKVRRKKYASL